MSYMKVSRPIFAFIANAAFELPANLMTANPDMTASSRRILLR